MDDSEFEQAHINESILVNSSYKRKFDKSLENVFIMPSKKSKHEENKFYSDINKETDQYQENIEETSQNYEPEPDSITNLQDENIKTDVEKNTEKESTEKNISNSLESSLANVEEVVSVISQIESDDLIYNEIESKLETSSKPVQVSDRECVQENEPIALIFKNKLLNQEFLDELGTFVPENIQALEKKPQKNKDTRFESNYCFNVEEFYAAISEHNSPLDTETKRIVFQFISLTCHQLLTILFENIEGWEIYTENTRKTLVKLFTNLIYDLLEDKLVSIFQSNLKKNQRILRSVNYILEAVSCVIVDKKNADQNLVSQKKIIF